LGTEVHSLGYTDKDSTVAQTSERERCQYTFQITAADTKQQYLQRTVHPLQ
jgi:hypothetical protein